MGATVEILKVDASDNTVNVDIVVRDEFNVVVSRRPLNFQNGAKVSEQEILDAASAIAKSLDDVVANVKTLKTLEGRTVSAADAKAEGLLISESK